MRGPGSVLRSVMLALLAGVVLTGCEFTGINDIPLPVGKGRGEGDLQVTVLLENSTNLVPNSEVRYDEVVVGSVRSIEFDDWRARLTLGIEKDAGIPADVTAKVAQKSLLGAEYVELSSSTAGGRLLADGAKLGLDRTGRYPETEEVLSAAALLLNNGGLPQLRTIAHELNQALSGRAGDVRSLVSEVSRFARSLDTQRADIVAALEAVDQFAVTVTGQQDQIDRALVRLPRGLRALGKERRSLTSALGSLDRFSGVAGRVFNENEDGLVANLRNLRPVTKQLADHADDLVQTLDAISFPFPIKSINKAFFGDYINFFAELSLNLSDTAEWWTHGTALEGLVGQLLGVPATAAQTGDPLRDPLADAVEATSEGTAGADGSDAPPRADAPRGAGSGTKMTDRNGQTPEDAVPPTSLLDALLGGMLGGSR